MNTITTHKQNRIYDSAKGVSIHFETEGIWAYIVVVSSLSRTVFEEVDRHKLHLAIADTLWVVLFPKLKRVISGAN